MQILIGTTNPSKVAYFEELLADADVTFVTPREEEEKERLKAFLRRSLGLKSPNCSNQPCLEVLR